MADDRRPLAPAAPSAPPAPAHPPARSRSRRVLALIAIAVLAVAAVGLLTGGRLLCAAGIELGGCPGAVEREPADPEAMALPGQVLLHLDSGLELDAEPPAEVSAAGGNLAAGDLFFDNRRATGGSLYTADHPLAGWSADGPPDAASCLDAIVSAGEWSADPKPGQVLCVQTTEGRIAALTVTQVLDDGVLFVSTVWS